MDRSSGKFPSKSPPARPSRSVPEPGSPAPGSESSESSLFSFPLSPTKNGAKRFQASFLRSPGRNGVAFPRREEDADAMNPAVGKQQTDDLKWLLEVMPPPVREVIEKHPRKGDLIEIVLDLGRRPEVRFPNRGEDISEQPVTREDIAFVVGRVGRFGKDNRAGIERTLHRISGIRNRVGDVVGLTCRVGRAV